MSRGIRSDGVRSVDDLQGRCWVNDITGCWEWRGGADGNGRPSLWLPELGRRVTLGVASCVLLTGRAPAKGVVWHCKCDTDNCANPYHRKAGTRSTQMLAAKLKRSPIERARIAAGKRAVSKISEADVAAIRESNEVLSVIAERVGVSVSHASNIRRGKQRQPLAARGASVFNLGSQP